MRVCWNRQTGTVEGRVSMTYEFKSRHSHHHRQTCFKGKNEAGLSLFIPQIDDFKVQIAP